MNRKFLLFFIAAPMALLFSCKQKQPDGISDTRTSGKDTKVVTAPAVDHGLAITITRENKPAEPGDDTSTYKVFGKTVRISTSSSCTQKANDAKLIKASEAN